MAYLARGPQCALNISIQVLSVLQMIGLLSSMLTTLVSPRLELTTNLAGGSLFISVITGSF